VTADPKQGRRVVDPDALRRARARGDECAACGGPPSNVHHVIQRGAPHFGDDVIENLLLLCGTGTSGCHGAWHGSPYVHYYQPWGKGAEPVAERRDKPWVAVRIGNFIERWSPDTAIYVVEKLGIAPAIVFLWNEYRIKETSVLRIVEEARAS
jgi:hypothetical protein